MYLSYESDVHINKHFQVNSSLEHIFFSFSEYGILLTVLRLPRLTFRLSLSYK
jgi:hypothetical protein